ncbi:MAG: hypothetical protein U0166_26280 [Acidobacteriota bacterium]
MRIRNVVCLGAIVASFAVFADARPVVVAIAPAAVARIEPRITVHPRPHSEIVVGRRHEALVSALPRRVPRLIMPM